MIKGYGNRAIAPLGDRHRIPYIRTPKSAQGREYFFPPRDIDADNLIARMTNLSKGKEYAIANLIINIKKDHDVKNFSDLFDCFYVFATDTTTNALLNWASSSFNCTVTGTAPFTADLGFTSNGTTGWLDTNFKPNQGVVFTEYSASMGLYVTVPLSPLAGNANVMGSTTGGTPGYNTRITKIGSGGALTIVSVLNQSTSTSGPSVRTYQALEGLISISRNDTGSPTPGIMYTNAAGNTLFDFNDTPVTLSNGTANFQILNVGSGTPTTETVGAAFIGSGLINQDALNRRLQEYMQSLGVAK